MSTQPRRVSSETPELDLQIPLRREALKLTPHRRALILLAGGFGILVLLILITGLGVVSRATLLFGEVSTINTKFRQLSLDLERLKALQIQTELPKLRINRGNLAEQQGRTTHNSQAGD